MFLSVWKYSFNILKGFHSYSLLECCLFSSRWYRHTNWNKIDIWCESPSTVKSQRLLLLLECQNVDRKCLMHIYESIAQPQIDILTAYQSFNGCNSLRWQNSIEFGNMWKQSHFQEGILEQTMVQWEFYHYSVWLYWSLFSCLTF